MKIKALSESARKKLYLYWFYEAVDYDINDEEEGPVPNKIHIFAWGWQFTPLTWAAFHGDLELVRELVEKGADINKAASGFTPLMCAAFNGKKDVAAYLLEKGADASYENKRKQTAYSLTERKSCCSYLGLFQAIQELRGHSHLDQTREMIGNSRPV